MSWGYFTTGSCASAAQVYSHGGRRLLPAMQMGSPAAFLACDAAWKLLAVGARGDLHLWDLRAQQCLVEASVRPLLGTAAPHVTGERVPYLVAYHNTCSSQLPYWYPLSTRYYGRSVPLADTNLPQAGCSKRMGHVPYSRHLLQSYQCGLWYGRDCAVVAVQRRSRNL